MYCLSIRQPWASMIAFGSKTLEVRSWTWSYRGPLLVCASKNPQLAIDDGPLPAGYAVGIVDVVGCRPFAFPADLEPAAFDPEEEITAKDMKGQYVFMLENPRSIVPFPMKGQLRPWKYDGPEPVLCDDHLDEFWRMNGEVPEATPPAAKTPIKRRRHKRRRSRARASASA